MSASIVFVRLIQSGECVEVPPDHPVVLARDVYAADRGQVIFGFRNDFLSQTTASTWLAEMPSEPAYVLECDDNDDAGGFLWRLAELPETRGIDLTRSFPPGES